MESTPAASTQPVAQQESQSNVPDNSAAPKEVKTNELKELDIDGNKVSLDALIERYKKSDSLDKASYKRFQEAAAARKEAENFRLEKDNLKKRLSENFEEAAQELGLDPYELSERTIKKRYEELTMTDDQRKMSDMERDYHRLKKLEDDIKSQRKNTEQQEFRNNVANYFDHNLSKSFESLKVEPDEYVVFSAAADLQNQLRNNVPIQHLDFEAAVKKAKSHKDKSVRRDPSIELEEILKNDEWAEKARKLLINRITKSPEKQSSPVVKNNEFKPNKNMGNNNKKYYTPQEFREMMENEGKNG